MSHLLTPEEVCNVLEQVDLDEVRHYPCSSGTMIGTLDVGEVIKAQLRKTIAELEEMEPESMKQRGSGNYANRMFSEAALHWLEDAKKEIGL